MFKKIALILLTLSLGALSGCKKEEAKITQQKNEKAEEIKKDTTNIAVKVEDNNKKNEVQKTENLDLNKKDENSNIDEIGGLKSIKTNIDNKTETFITELEGKISENILKATFYVSGKKTEESNFSANSIKIAITGDVNVEQELKFDETESADEERAGLILEDINFDGFKDLRIQESISAGPNTPYLYWIWNKDKSFYERATELDELTSPIVDAENKKIITEVKDSPTTYFTNEYKFENNKLTQIKEIKKEYDENDPSKAKFTIRELKNGKLTVVKTYVGDAE
ncbi:hypothetical protein JXR93_08735 [bacterium]|nr:hypothetical protein [bacterium]